MLAPWKKSYDKPRQYVKKQRHYFADKSSYGQSYDFSSGHVQMWKLDNKISWAPKNWCLWTVVLEKTLDSPLDSEEIKPVNHNENQPWIFIGRTDAEVPNTLPIWGKEPTHWKRLWCWERLTAGGEGDKGRWDGWMALPTHDMSLSKLQVISKNREAWHAVVHGVAKSRTWLSDWTTTSYLSACFKLRIFNLSNCSENSQSHLVSNSTLQMKKRISKLVDSVRTGC